MPRLVLQPYHWFLHDKKSINQTLVCAWCLDDNANTVLVKFIGFYIPVYVLYPLSWTLPDVDAFMEKFHAFVARKDHNYRPDSIKYSITYRRLLYFYQQETTPLIEICVNNEAYVGYLRQFIKVCTRNIGPGDPAIIEVYEHNIPTVRKFLGYHDCKYSQWIEICQAQESPPEARISNVMEYYTHWTDLKPLEREHVVYPRILSFDIETYSDVYNMFPQAEKGSNCIFIISLLCQVVNHPETRKKYVILYGDCYDIPGVDIIRVEREEDMFPVFGEIVNALQPHIITGYNIFGFDYSYMDTRIRRKVTDWPSMGSLQGHKIAMVDKSWFSKNGRHNKRLYVPIPGCINFDLMVYARKELKLIRYTLNEVAKSLLNEEKHDVSAQDMFKAFDALRKERNEETLEEMTRIVRYCVQDSDLVLNIIDKIQLWINLVETSNILQCNIEDIYISGIVQKVTSQLYLWCHKHDIVMSPDPRHKKGRGKGAYVAEPMTGIHKYVICLDFNSLYPSIIDAFNICYTTFVIEGSIPDEKCHVIEWDEDDRHYKYRFIKEPRGIIPLMASYLVEERKRIKKLLASHKGTTMGIVYDCRQLALKVAANSIYGSLGFEDGNFPLIEGLSSVTAWGRKLINTCNDYLQQKYQANIIYNDTDSVFFNIPSIQNWPDAYQRGEELAVEVSSIFPPPLRLEMEKVGKMMCLKKKMYAFWPYNHAKKDLDRKDDGEPRIIPKGIIEARRDNCTWHRNFYHKVLLAVINEMPYADVISLVYDEASRLLHRQVSPFDLRITQQMGDNYKSDSYHMKVFGDRMRDQGTAINPGERIQFLILEGSGKTVGERMCLAEHYSGEPIAYDHYLKRMINSIESMLGIIYREVIIEKANCYEKYFHSKFLYFLLTKFPKHTDKIWKSIQNVVSAPPGILKGNGMTNSIREGYYGNIHGLRDINYLSLNQIKWVIADLGGMPGMKTLVKKYQSRFLGRTRPVYLLYDGIPVTNMKKVYMEWRKCVHSIPEESARWWRKVQEMRLMRNGCVEGEFMAINGI